MLYKQGKVYEIKFFKKTNRKEFSSEKHPLYGGMMENSRFSLKCPVEPNGARKKILDEDEITILSQDLNIPKEALSHYNGIFWNEYRLELTKGDKRLDLDNPLEYIDYKVAINLFPIIAPDFSRAKDHPYIKYYVEDVNENSSRTRDKARQRKDVYDLYDKYKDERYTLKYILEKNGKITPSTTSIVTLQDMMLDEMENGSLDRLSATFSELNIRTKAIILEGIEVGILSKNPSGRIKARNSELGTLSFKAEDPTMENVAMFLSDPKNNEALNMLRALNKKEK